MADVLSKGNLFDPILVTDLFDKVRGKSSVATLGKRTPIAFSGNKIFTFEMDSEVDIVAENGKKTKGGMTLAPVVMAPIKFEYSARVSDEFLYASEENKIEIIKSFNEGFAKKLARGLDIAAILGLNPRSKEAANTVGDNCLAKKVDQKVTYESATADVKIEEALGLVEGSEYNPSGIVIAPSVRTDISKMRLTGGSRAYPDFAFGATPSNLGSQKLEVNNTVSFNTPTNKLVGVVGDFETAFQWGYAKDVMLEVIKYGDPDSQGKDLKAYNQVCLRAEAYIGWGVLDGKAFAKLETAE